MEAIVKALINNKDLGPAGLFIIILLAMFWLWRKDQKEHRAEYKEVSLQMFEVITQNTEASTKLSESITDLKDQVKRT